MTGVLDFTASTIFTDFEYSGFSYVDMVISASGTGGVDLYTLTTATALQDTNIILSDIRFLLITFFILFLTFGFYTLFNDLLGKR